MNLSYQSLFFRWGRFHFRWQKICECPVTMTFMRQPPNAIGVLDPTVDFYSRIAWAISDVKGIDLVIKRSMDRWHETFGYRADRHIVLLDLLRLHALRDFEKDRTTPLPLVGRHMQIVVQAEFSA